MYVEDVDKRVIEIHIMYEDSKINYGICHVASHPTDECPDNTRVSISATRRPPRRIMWRDLTFII